MKYIFSEKYVNIKGKVSKDKKASMSRYLAKYLDPINPGSVEYFF